MSITRVTSRHKMPMKITALDPMSSASTPNGSRKINAPKVLHGHTSTASSVSVKFLTFRR